MSDQSYLKFYQVKSAGSNSPIIDSPTEKIHRWGEVNNLVNTHIRIAERFTTTLLNAVLIKWYGEDAAKFFDKPFERHNDKYFSGSIEKNVSDNLEELFKQFLDYYYQNVYKKMVIDSFNISARRFTQDAASQSFNADLIKFNDQNYYVRQVQRNGLKVITDIIFKSNLETIRESLADSAFRNLSVAEMRKELETKIGKGTQWKYNRMIRSEVSLSLDSATIAENQLNGIKYVQWKSALNPCPVCRKFSNLIWISGENPRPVYSTHPHCFCVIRPKIKLKSTETTEPKYDVPEEMRYEI